MSVVENNLISGFTVLNGFSILKGWANFTLCLEIWYKADCNTVLYEIKLLKHPARFVCACSSSRSTGYDNTTLRQGLATDIEDTDE